MRFLLAANIMLVVHKLTQSTKRRVMQLQGEPSLWPWRWIDIRSHCWQLFAQAQKALLFWLPFFLPSVWKNKQQMQSLLRQDHPMQLSCLSLAKNIFFSPWSFTAPDKDGRWAFSAELSWLMSCLSLLSLHKESAAFLHCSFDLFLHQMFCWNMTLCGNQSFGHIGKSCDA